MRRYALSRILFVLAAAVCCPRLGAQSAPASSAPPAQTIYTSVPGSSAVFIINSATNSVVGSIAIPPATSGGAPSAPSFIALTPDGKFLYVLDDQSQATFPAPASAIDVVDTSSNAVVATIPVDFVSSGVTTGGCPREIVFSPDGSKGYFTDTCAGTLTILDTASHAMTNISPSMGFLSSPGLTISPDGNRVYIGLNNGLAVYDTVAATITTIPFPQSLGGPLQVDELAATPDGKQVLLGLGGGEWGLFDTTSSAFSLVSAGGSGCTPGGIGITPDGKSAFEGDIECGGIIELNIASDTGTNFVLPDPNGPLSQYFAFTSDSQTAYASGGYSRNANTQGNVQVFSVSTNASIAVISVAQSPAFGIAIMPPPTVAVATTIGLSSSSSSSVFGQQVSFTATVNPNAASTLIPSGTVTFSDGAATLGTATLSSGAAVFNTASLSVGNHNITAAYGGDSNFAPSTSNVSAQVVSQAGTAATVSASPSPATVGQAVMLTATVGAVAPGAGVPTGSATFLDGATALGTGTLNGSGTATFSASSLASGNHSLSASYGGDTDFTASTSAPVTLIVQSSAPATHLAVSAPAAATAAAPFSVVVTALDGSNNQVTGYTDTVSFTSTDAHAALPSPYTFVASDLGKHVFTFILNTAGSATITATDTTNTAINGTSAPISVTSAAPPPVQITDNEAITVSDAESFPDIFDAEAVHLTDAVFVTPLIAVTAPVAEFSDGGLGFGGQSGTQTILVSNIGQAPLAISSATISGSAQFSIAQISCSNGATSLSTQLPEGGVCALAVNYAASAAPATDIATLVFNDNAALSNLPTAPSGTNYAQSIPLNGGGANIGPPPPPPAIVSVMDNEMVHVADTESFHDVFDGEAVHVRDQVTLATLQAITITPANSTIANGATESFRAFGTFSDGSQRDLTALVAWSSSNLAVARMNANTTTAVGVGQTTISGTLGTLVGTTSLTVRIPFLRITAAFFSITKSANSGYMVTISVTNTGDIAANSVTPILGILGSATTGTSTAATNLAPGATAMITLSFPGSAGKAGSVQPLLVLGSATGTDPSGTPSPPTLWLLPPTRVTLP